MSKNIKLIVGTTREGRLSLQIAAWVQTQTAKNTDINIEVVDVKELNLPLLDAPIPPAYAPVPGEAAAAWREKVAQADGFIFVTAEYNRSIPASLKNAIDYVSAEWKTKPAAVVSYGYLDGGMSANNHLHDVMDWFKMPHADAESRIALQLTQDIVVDGQLQNAAADFAQYEAPLQSALAQLAA